MDGRRFSYRLCLLSALSLGIAAMPVWAGNDAWTVAGVPSGGGCGAITINPTTPSTLYCISSPGIFESTDSGAHWKLVLTLPTNNASDLAIEPEKPTTLYAATQGDGIWTSTDGGATWTAANTGIPALGNGFTEEDSIFRISADPVNDGVAYAVTLNHGLYKTTDGGAHWVAANNGISDLQFNGAYMNRLVVDPVNPQLLYLAEEVFVGGGLPGTTSLAGIYTSTDGGSSWSQTGLAGTGVLDLTMDPSNHQHLLATTLSGIYSTTDSGAHWAALSGTVPEMSTLAIDPSNPNHILAGSYFTGLYSSTDGGASFSAENPADQSSIADIAFDPVTATNVYDGVVAFGLDKSTDGGSTWGESDTGIYGITVNSMFMDSSGVIYLAADGSGVYKSADQGVSWTQINNGIGFNEYLGIYVYGLVEDPEVAATLYAATPTGVYKTVNSGGNWALLSNGITDPYSMAVAVDPEDSNNVFAGTQSKDVFKSVDGGNSWQSASAGITDTEVLSLAVSPTDSKTVFAGTQSKGLFKSTDGGTTWNTANTGLPVTGVWVVAIDPKNPQTLYASLTNQDIYKSTDGGATWASASTGLPLGDIYTSIQIDPNNTSTLYVSPIVGAGDVYVSTDGAAHWVDLVTGQPSLAQMSAARTQGALRLPTRFERAMRGTARPQSSGTTASVGAVAADPRSTNVYGADKSGQVYVFNAAGVSSTPSTNGSGGSGSGSGNGNGSGGTTGGGTTGGGSSGSSGGGGAFSLLAGLLLGLGLLRRRAE